MCLLHKNLKEQTSNQNMHHHQVTHLVLRFKTSNKIYSSYVTQISFFFFFLFEKKNYKVPYNRNIKQKSKSTFFAAASEEFHHSIQLGSLLMMP